MSIAFVGEKLSSRLLVSMKAGNRFEFDELCVTSVAILLQEVESRPLTDHPEHLEFIIVIYLEFFDAVNEPSRCPERDVWLTVIPPVQARRNSIATSQGLAKGLSSLILSTYSHLFLNRY